MSLLDRLSFNQMTADPWSLEKAVRLSVAAYAQIQESLDELSQINYELLRRGEEGPSQP